jgi:hypothetical protein
VSALLRIVRRRGAASDDPGKDYLDRLIKLIPAEVIGLYLAGKGAIQAYYAPAAEVAGAAKDAALAAPHPLEGLAWLFWFAVCLIGVFVVRGWATSDPASGLKPQWKAVGIAAFSFVVWVYSFGDGFARWGLWNPLFASLLVFAWSFFVPFIYKGDGDSGQGVVAPARKPHGAGDQTPAAPVGKDVVAAQAFGAPQAEACVLASAKHLTGRLFSIMDKVSDGFEDEHGVRGLLSDIQDRVRDDYGKTVDIASGDTNYISDIGKMTFLYLSAFLVQKVNA